MNVTRPKTERKSFQPLYINILYKYMELYDLNFLELLFASPTSPNVFRQIFITENVVVDAVARFASFGNVRVTS